MYQPLKIATFLSLESNFEEFFFPINRYNKSMASLKNKNIFLLV
jgi:hypothetical protein